MGKLSAIFLPLLIITSGCVNSKIIKPINKQYEENLNNLSVNLAIVTETYIPVIDAYLDFKIEQLRVKKEDELLKGDTKLTPEDQIKLEFYHRDNIEKKKELLTLLNDLLTTLKSQTEIAKIHLEAYKSFAESGKLTQEIKQQITDSQLQIKALSMLKLDPQKAEKIKQLLFTFK